ncbi:MAG: FAD/NAD(P)-binding protein, partial [Desulfobulbaceae bacterium]|nr:FAD/NAD(P)-binding protein [Desulfobulbaceae bacterium]
TFSLTIRRAGRLTDSLHELSVGDTIGVRGPYGRPFPLDELQGSNLLFVAGGIGLAPLRSAITHALANRDGYGKIKVLYGSKHPAELCFVDDMARWREQGVECLLTVDEADDSWRGRVGLVTGLLDDVEPVGPNWAALVCGPSIMIRFVLTRLQAMGMSDDRLITTLERHMKCGVGICNHCYLDGRLVCADGPVFYRSELAGLEVL